MASLQDVYNDNPYDGDPLDGDEIFLVEETDVPQTQGITVQQFVTKLLDLTINVEEINVGPTDGKRFYQQASIRTEGDDITALLFSSDLSDKGMEIFYKGTSTQNSIKFRATNSEGVGAASILEIKGDEEKVIVKETLEATTKNFLIDHPNPDKTQTHKLRHGSLEGPEHGVYYRGTLDGSAVIDLPEYWPHLVDDTTITVNLTAVGGFQKLYVKTKSVDQIKVGIEGGSASDIHADFTVYAERKDVDSLTVEEEK